jgi:hypothetical protein
VPGGSLDFGGTWTATACTATSTGTAPSIYDVQTLFREYVEDAS